MFTATKCLVTGGAGFIGSHLVQALLAEGAPEVRILDDLSSGRESNLSGIPAEQMKRVRVVRGDVRTPSDVQAATRGVELVFHHAAMTSVQGSIANPAACHDVNVVGTLNVLNAAREAGVQKVVFASSSAVYGESPVSPKAEILTPDPLSPYAASKWAGERYCATFSKLHGVSTVALRYFNVFGPRQDPSSQYAAVIPKFIHAALQNEPVTVNGDGEQSRDFVFVQDVARANLLAASVATEPGAVFNVGTGIPLTINQLIRHLSQLLGRPLRAQHGPTVSGDIKHSLADVSKIRERLGFKPAVAFADGLAQTLQSFGR